MTARTRRAVARIVLAVCVLLLVTVVVFDIAAPGRLPAHGLLIAVPAVAGIVAELAYLRGAR